MFINSLNNKPSVIVCSETWIINHVNSFNLTGYKNFYNGSKINKADGVVLYIRNSINQETEIFEIDRIKFLVADLNLNNNVKMKISAIYTSHDVPKTEFVLSVKKFLEKNRKLKNHCIIGDFNIDIMYKESQKYENNINQEFLNNFLTYEYVPWFQGITRPSSVGQGGTCIDNFYIKTNISNVNAYKITNPFNDHFPLLVTFSEIRLPKKVY